MNRKIVISLLISGVSAIGFMVWMMFLIALHAEKRLQAEHYLFSALPVFTMIVSAYIAIKENRRLQKIKNT